MDDLKCPPLALWASSAEKSFLISRLERPHLHSNESPSGAFKRQSGLRKQMEGRCPDKLCGALQTLFHERSCDGKMHLISATFLVKMVERNARRRSVLPKSRRIFP